MRLVSRLLAIHLLGLVGLTGAPIGRGDAVAAEPGSPPYPSSQFIAGMEFAWLTHKRRAPGSDNWPITWAADDHQYTVWGDGGGFGGTDSKGRAQVGVARVEGTASVYRGKNVWGGYKAEVKAKPPGKSYGIIAIGNELYHWRCHLGPADNSSYSPQRLFRSTNKGRAWTVASWDFAADLPFYCPTFLQFGKAYAGALDTYVYMYAAERDQPIWDIHVPGRIMLMRAPKDRLMDRTAYEFFTGRTELGEATWSPDVMARQPVVEDANGIRLASAAYNPGLGRYLVGYAHTERRVGNMALLDGPTPWGPWTTVTYQYGWGQGSFTGTCCLLWYFAPKWWSQDGRGFTITFSGGDGADSWNTVEGTFIVPPPPLPVRVATR